MLLNPVPPQSKIDLAVSEASKLKKVLGYLRHLWRSSEGAHDTTVLELKQMVQPRSGLSSTSSSPAAECSPLKIMSSPASSSTSTLSVVLAGAREAFVKNRATWVSRIASVVS
jgi:hypothetical protein